MASRRARIAATCAAASGVLTVMRTSSDPARQRSNTWRAVASASAVSVLVIDWTTIGAPPPTATLPIITCVETLRPACIVDGASVEREARDLDLALRRKVDQPVVVGQAHVLRVADHQDE